MDKFNPNKIEKLVAEYEKELRRNIFWRVKPEQIKNINIHWLKPIYSLLDTKKDEIHS